MAEQALTVQQQPKAALVAGGNVAAIIPRNIEEVFRLAAAMVQSGMAPASLKTPEQAMVAILAGAELGLPPFQSLQSFAIINNRPAIWGDGMVAVVRSNGFQIKEWLDGADDDLTAWCTVTRPDNGEEITRSFSVADARKANLWGKQGPWQTNPKRMLQMRARGFACRDGAADVLRGFQLREEVEDYTDIPQRGAPPPVRSDVRARLEARGAQSEGFNSAFTPEPDPETAEFVDKAEAAAEFVEAELHAEPEEIIESDLPGHDDEPDDDFPGDRPSAALPITDPEPFAPKGGNAIAWGKDMLAWIPTASAKIITEAWAEAKREGKTAALQHADADLFDAIIQAKEDRLDALKGGR